MQAVVMQDFGPPQVLVPEATPEPGLRDTEVLIEAEYANITFVETQIRAGRPPHPSMLPGLPAILGNGVGGVVVQDSRGDGGMVGRRVVTSLGGTGGYAERAVAAAERLVEVPEGMVMRDAVALLADGRTALGLVRLAELNREDTVLVEAAAGGVGTLLVQLARNAGAQVVALAGDERKRQLALDLGAELAISYRDADWARQVRAAVGGVTVVFDGVGGSIGLDAFNLLRPGGRFCPFGMSSGAFAPVGGDKAAGRGIALLRAGPSSVRDQTALTRDALTEGEQGRLRAVIGQEFPLAQAAAAHAAIEARETIGKTLLLSHPAGS